MIIFPYRTDSSARKLPIVNIILTTAVLAISLLFYFGKLDASFINSVMLSKLSIFRVVGSILIQPNLLSIVFVFFFMLLLGNAVNSIAGNIYYALLLILFCFVFSWAHLLLSDVMAIGANGIISGLAGFALAILPANKLVIYQDNQNEDEDDGFSIITIVFLWCLFDSYAVVNYPAIPCLTAQLAVFAFGIAVALLLVKIKLVNTNEPTFTEWMNDKVALLFSVDLMGAIMPAGRKLSADDKIKGKADKLLELISAGEKNFNPVEPVEETMEPLIESPAKTEIKFRLLKGIKMKDNIVLYFAFEGEKISDVSIEAESYKCEIYPHDVIKPGDSGSIKIYSSNIDRIVTVSLLLKYNLCGVLTTKEIIYSARSNEINN